MLAIQANPPIKPCNTTRIMSWNVHNWTDVFSKASEESARATIIKIRPDILALQEAYTANSSVFLKELHYIVVDHDQAHGLLVAMVPEMAASIRNHALRILLPSGSAPQERAAQEVEFDDIRIYNTHLDVQDASGETRTQQIRRLLSCATVYKENTVVVGDLNCIRRADYTAAHWNKIKESSCVTWTAITEIGWEDRTQQSLSVWSGKRVDFVLLHETTCLVVQNQWISPSIASDHFPLVVDLKYRHTVK
jgi:endonuclease/exonuclease/phosphatase family metal-dependent hydrolase